METAEEKLAFLNGTKLHDLSVSEIAPDNRNNWLNLAKNDFDDLLPLASKAAKSATKPKDERVVFKLFSLGVSTSRDEWVYGRSESEVRSKASFLIGVYNTDLDRAQQRKEALDASELTYDIKWTRAAKTDLAAGLHYRPDQGVVIAGAYRPFDERLLNFNGRLIEVQYQQTRMFGEDGARPNKVITFTDAGSQKPFMVLACRHVFDYHFVGAAAAATGVPLHRYEESGNRTDNITEWSLDQFRKHYQPGRGKKDRPITKEAIFHYVYGVLHDPVYRDKYALNLKREFPRIPLYSDFWQWADWGLRLMDLHIGFESVAPWALARTDVPDEKARRTGQAPKALLKADKDAGVIRLDSETTLTGVPAEAWDYRLGNRSALEWVLDQYKEKTPKDPTIREKFNTYRFVDYKDRVIDLLARVTTVSVETMKIVAAMRRANR
jgi:predicted helicase